MKKLMIFFGVILISFSITAQKKYRFQSQNYIGFLEGDNKSSYQFQTINGCNCGDWFVGLGTGVDGYLYRSVPLFLSVNRNFDISNRKFFLSLDGGTNFAWYNRETGNFGNIIKSDFSPGLYWGTGVGYKAMLRNKKDAIVLSLGYNFKQLREEQETAVFCINPPCPNFIENYNYRMRRLSVRLGWLF